MQTSELVGKIQAIIRRNGGFSSFNDDMLDDLFGELYPHEDYLDRELDECEFGTAMAEIEIALFVLTLNDPRFEQWRGEH